MRKKQKKQESMPEKVLSDQTRRDTMKKNDRRNTMYDTCIFDLYGTLVDIRTDEDKAELWERLSLFYAYYGAKYTPDELKRSYRRLTEELTAGHRALRRDSHEAFPEIRIEEVFQALKRGSLQTSRSCGMRNSSSASFPRSSSACMKGRKRC